MKGVISLKKDRNCGATPYPVYPNMYGGVPMQGMPMQGVAGPVPIAGVEMPMPMPMPAPTPIMSGNMTSSPSYTTSEINTLSQQVNSLEQRVSNLENMVSKSYSNNYNTSNYQMM